MNKKRILNETDDQIRVRLEKRRESRRKSRADETPDQRKVRLEKH